MSARSGRDLETAVLNGARISPDDALCLLRHPDLLRLGQLADSRRRRHQPSDTVTFIIDRNINYTNICRNRCSFCAFYRDADDPEAYVLDQQQVLQRVAEAVDAGASQVMIQGGLNPDLRIDYFEQLFQAIKARFPVTIHSLTPTEIWQLAQQERLSCSQVLERLRRAGLDSLPGGGAEILVDRVRQRVSPQKISADQWLAVMEAAHAIGMRTTATMMMGTVETPQERIAHLQQIRRLQDRSGGFRAFIPWTFKPGNTALARSGVQEIASLDYLRLLAVARIFLDNVEHVQGSWVTQGRDIGQLSLHFGGNDLGSIMLEENVVRAAGVTSRISVDEMVELIRRAGRTPALRDTAYRILRTY